MNLSMILAGASLGFGVCLWIILRHLASPPLGLVDQPRHRKIHLVATPNFGGLAILSGFLAGLGICLALGWAPPAGQGQKVAVLACLLTGGWVLGALDDRRSFRPAYKFIGQIVLALGLVLSVGPFEVLWVPGLVPLGFGNLAVPLTVTWTLMVMNGFNFLDGVDGLAGSVAMVSLLTLLFLASGKGPGFEMLVAALALGPLLAFLILNWHPAKIFLGDNGSLVLGLMVSWLTIQTCGKLETEKGHQFVVLASSLIVLVPLAEVTLTTLRRLVRGNALSRADQGHAHHRLLRLGFRPPLIVLALGSLAVFGGAAGSLLAEGYLGKASWPLVGAVLLMGIGLHQLGYLEIFMPKNGRDDRRQMKIANHFVSMQILKLRGVDQVSDALELIEATARELEVKSFEIEIKANGHRDEVKHHWQAGRTGPKPFAADTEGFSDGLRLQGDRGFANWVFVGESQDEDYDVEKRVLFSEFNSQVLAKIWGMSKQQKVRRTK